MDEPHIKKQPSTHRRQGPPNKREGLKHNPDALANVPTTEHPLWPKFKEWAEEHIPDMQLAVWWECFLKGAQASREFEHQPPPLRAGMSIEEAIDEGHQVGIDTSKSLIIVDGKPMPLIEGKIHNVDWRK